ncbi:MAG: MotA/TolQ/ExbB proton channel family protein [Planctomycetota bacterium]|nr:MotA/TolQ/ExbB proton channel family protein [Planctomycetota bacterium]
MNKWHALLLVLSLWGASTFALPTYAQDEGAAPAAAAPTEPGAHTGPVEENYVMWIIRNSGIIGLVILLLSFYFIATVVRLFLELRPQVVAPPDLVARCGDMIQQRDFRGLYNMVKEEDSFLGRVLAAGIAELPNGLSDAREAMDRSGESETVEMEKRISMLAVLGTLGPMIGLLGTLKGMIASFGTIARGGTETIKPAEVAGGISEALLLTFEGVMLAVPAIYFFAVFRNRVQSLSVSTMLQADELLRHVSQAIRTKAPAGGNPPPRPASPA